MRMRRSWVVPCAGVLFACLGARTVLADDANLAAGAMHHHHHHGGGAMGGFGIGGVGLPVGGYCSPGFFGGGVTYGGGFGMSVGGFGTPYLGGMFAGPVGYAWGPGFGPWWSPPLAAVPAFSPPVTNIIINNNTKPAVPPAGANFAPAPAGAQPAPAVRKSNDDNRAKARQYLVFGDEHFKAHRYNEAHARYRKAETFAPDLAEVFARQAWTMLAMRNHARAAFAFRRALALDPLFANSGFQLDELYAEHQVLKKDMLEDLAAAAVETRDNPDLLFLIGVTLYFDGQQNRSRPFFERARELSAGDTSYLAGFLPTVNVAGKDAAPAFEF